MAWPKLGDKLRCEAGVVNFLPCRHCQRSLVDDDILVLYRVVWHPGDAWWTAWAAHLGCCNIRSSINSPGWEIVASDGADRIITPVCRETPLT